MLAIVALVAAAAAGAFLFLGSRTPKTSTEPLTLPSTIHRHTTSTSTLTSKTSPVKKPNKPKPKPKPEPTSLSTSLDASLAVHPVVVVSIYAPDVATDTQAMNEAKAGAAEVGAGFIAIDVYNEQQARQLAALLSTSFNVTNPSVLFFKRPHTLALDLSGFVDSAVVAQAASELRPTIEFWASQARTICLHYGTTLGALEVTVRNADLTAATGRTEAAKAMDQAAAIFNEEASALSAIKVSPASAGSFAELVADFHQAATNKNSEARALRGNNLTAARAVETKDATLIASINTVVAKLNLSGCGA